MDFVLLSDLIVVTYIVVSYVLFFALAFTFVKDFEIKRKNKGGLVPFNYLKKSVSFFK